MSRDDERPRRRRRRDPDEERQPLGERDRSEYRSRHGWAAALTVYSFKAAATRGRYGQ